MSENINDKLLYVGSIATPHGVIGHVKIKSFTDPISNIAKMNLYDENGAAITLKLIKASNDFVICKVNDISDRNIIEKLRGTKLFVHRSTLPTIKEEENYYIEDLIGREIRNIDNNPIGFVEAVYNFGAGDVIEINFTDGDISMFPFSKNIFPKITNEYIMFIAPQTL